MCERIRFYDQYVTKSYSPSTGEVTLYLKKQWEVNRIKENVMKCKQWTSSEYMAKFENISFIIVLIYSSPSYSKTEFCEYLQQILMDLCERSNDIMIVGAFNLDWQANFYKVNWKAY